MADSGEKPNSTAQSLLDRATATVQSGLGYVTGSQPDQAQAEARADRAAAQQDASHTAARLGGMTATPGGGMASDDPARRQGAWDQTIGSAKEAVGGLVGHQGLKQAGAEQHASGQEQEARGQLRDLGQGLSDRAHGFAGETLAGLQGDAEAKQQYAAQREDGKARQRGVEADLGAQADAQAKQQQK